MLERRDAIPSTIIAYSSTSIFRIKKKKKKKKKGKRKKMEKCDFRFDWRVSWTVFMDGSVYAIEAI